MRSTLITLALICVVNTLPAVFVDEIWHSGTPEELAKLRKLVNATNVLSIKLVWITTNAF